MEDFVLTAIVGEIRAELQGLTIDTIAHLSRTELVISAARRPTVRDLFISCDPSQPRLYLLDPNRRGGHASEETALSARLNRQLQGSEIKSVEKIPYDRILKITLFNPYLGEGETIHLYLELIDRATNLFLTDASETVIDQLQEDADWRRALSSGAVYVQPFRLHKLDPREMDREKFYEILSSAALANEPISKTLVHSFSGFSPRLAQEVAARAGSQREKLWDSFTGILEEVHKDPPRARIYSGQPLSDLDYRTLDPGRDLVLSSIALTQYETFHTTEYDSINAAARAYYGVLSEWKAYQQLSKSLSSALAARRIRQERLLGHLKQELAEFEQAEKFKVCGELILASMYKLEAEFRAAARRGETNITVENYYDHPPSQFRIEVDPKLTLSENADRYFQRYRKAKRGLSTLKAKIPTLERQLQALEQGQAQVASAKNLAQLRAISETLVKPKPARRKKIEITKGKQAVGEITVRRFTTSDGYEILVGRSGRENDYLTFKVAAPYDLWLHAADYPGSHVVIRNPQKTEIPDQSVREAAQLAAYYSQARKNGKVPVHYTQRKFVHKPKGVAPGLVTLAQFRTIVVEPKSGVPKSEG
jgi:predicted ribosome quality control (RQC) complex YloA/Tae2 family protein